MRPIATVSSFFVLRTPLLPFESFLALGDASGASDPSRTHARLRAFASRPEIREALFVASPSFDRALERWLSGARDDDVPLTLLRYLARMATRATPFGLFAGCSVGRTGEADTHLVLGPQSTYRRHTRLDAGYLAALAEGLERDPALRDALLFFPSPGLYESAGKIRHAEATRLGSGERSYGLVAITPTPYLAATFARASGGARRRDLAEALLDDDIDLEDALAYVDSLIASQLLTSSVSATVTGDEPAAVVLDALSATGDAGRRAAEALAQTRQALRALDDTPLGASPDRYRAIEGGLAHLPAPADIARLFHVDLYKPAPDATLGAGAARLIDEAVALVARLAPRAPNEAMQSFLRGFVARYGEGHDGPLASRRMVPLTEALDDDRGLPFGTAPRAKGRSPLLEGLAFGAEESARTPFGPREEHLLRGLSETLRGGRTEWMLDEADLRALSPATPAQLPDSFAFMGTLASSAPGELRVLVDFLGGPSGAMLFGRFCHGDAALHRAVTSLVRAEEALRPDAVFAEIVHVPEGRMGNILARPMLRGYEIPYLGRSLAPEDRQILVTDLHLVLDRGHLVLFSKRLGREVIPRLTSAHAFSRSKFAIYRFLGEMQHGRERYAFGWDWGPLARGPFLPRVSCGSVVLALARYRLAKQELAPLERAGAIERFRLVQALRGRRNLPRWVVLVDGDRALPVDLDDAVHVASFAALVARREEALLEELFPAPSELVAEGPEGRFAHQLIVPFVRRPTSPPVDVAPPVPIPERTVRRSHGPGSEWLAVRLDTDPASADTVISELVAPAVARARRTTTRWFFERRQEPRLHLRLAFRGDPARLVRLLPWLQRAAAPLLEDGRLEGLAVETYDRDLERHGDTGIELAEAIFEADSAAALAIIARLDPANAGEERWQLALRGCHDLLLDLGLDLAARSEVIRCAYESTARELATGTALEHALGARFRQRRADLESLFVADAPREHPLAAGLAALATRSTQIRAAIANGRADEPMPRERVVGFLEAHVSRLLRSDFREHSLVLYDFLRRRYVSEAARAPRGEVRR